MLLARYNAESEASVTSIMCTIKTLLYTLCSLLMNSLLAFCNYIVKAPRRPAYFASFSYFNEKKTTRKAKERDKLDIFH